MSALLLVACGGSGSGPEKEPVSVPPAAPSVTIEGDIKQLVFTWAGVSGTTYFRLMENPDGHYGFTQVGDNIPAGTVSVARNVAVHLFDWVNAQYVVEACNSTGCSSSDVVSVQDVVLDAIGYFKASNTNAFVFLFG